MCRLKDHRLAIAVIAALLISQGFASASESGDGTFDEQIASGPNYQVAEFRLWLPEGPGPLRGALVLVPGSNSDGRPMAHDPAWQAFAAKQRLAIIACRFTDTPHEKDFIEEYVNASQGSGQALLDALRSFASRSQRPELADSPLLLWGISAGGEFNYEFAAWKPERVIAFVVNKGGIYYSALVPAAARAVPALFFVGERDLAARTDVIKGLFAINRRAGALWALIAEPAVGHDEGRSREVSLLFFEDVLPLRLGAPGSPLRSMDESSGFVADLATGRGEQLRERSPADRPTSWLPTERVARACQSIN